MHQPFHTDEVDRAHLLDGIRDWWRGTLAKWVRPEDIAHWSDAEIEATAADFGMAPADFLKSVGGREGTVIILEGLLRRRLQSLSLEPAEIRRLSPTLLSELNRNCKGCQDKERCVDDFAESEKPVGWESYCPNAGTLRTLA